MNDYHCFRILLPLLLLLSHNIYSQDSTETLDKSRWIRLYSGIGYSAVRHDYYGSEKYTGAMLPFLAELEKQSYHKSWKLYAGFSDGTIKTENSEGVIQNYELGFDLSYSVYHFTLFGKDSRFFLGPSVFLFAQSRKEERLNVYDPNVTLGMLALGPDIGMSGKFTYRLSYFLMAKMNLLSYAGHEEFSHGFLSPAKAFHYAFTMAFDWQIKGRMYLTARYQFTFCSIRKWDDFVAGSDLVLAGLNIKL